MSRKKNHGMSASDKALLGLGGLVAGGLLARKGARHFIPKFRNWRTSQAKLRIKPHVVPLSDARTVAMDKARKAEQAAEKNKHIALDMKRNDNGINRGAISERNKVVLKSESKLPKPQKAPVEKKPADVIDFAEAKRRHLEKRSSISDNFWSGFNKQAQVNWGHVGSTAAELGGLGILARPAISRLKGKPMDENTAAKYEIGGLGLLAAPYVAGIGKSLLTRGKAGV